MSGILSKPVVFNFTDDKKELIEKAHEALYFSKLMGYAQGFTQLRAVPEGYGWDLSFGETAKIW